MNPLTVANDINRCFTDVTDALVGRLPYVIIFFHIDSKTCQDLYKSNGITACNFKLQLVTNNYVFKELK